MCGIFCSISRHDYIPPSDGIQQRLQSRGPDASNSVLQHQDGCYLTLASTVLSLRGWTTTEQPYQRAGSRSTLCWNGEAWTIDGERPAGNDTSAVFDLLSITLYGCADSNASTEHRARFVSFAMSKIAGPYAFVYYDEFSSAVFFGRDFLGRRSLLYRITDNGDVLLSSITDGGSKEAWTEVEADGIYCLKLKSHPLHPSHESSTWAGVSVTKVPYLFANRGDASNTSVGFARPPMSTEAHGKVIPLLSLNRLITEERAQLQELSPSVLDLEKELYHSLSLRILDIPDPPQRARDLFGFARSKLAILFSGGLDCTALARVSHDLLPNTEAIDLLNVAFENPRVHKSAGEGAFEMCPDRITGRASHSELCRICPGREWRFVAVNIPYSEFLEHRSRIITLMHPHNTEMDLSIAAALYFAARGTGFVASQAIGQDAHYTSSARVLLSGLGADELFAGYRRHATAFNRNGFGGLLDELELDVSRLGKRNLGRDDRVISHWGREARFPFLDEGLVSWALAAPVSEKCDFGASKIEAAEELDSFTSIEPGKKVLRCLAWKLGMTKVANEKKRAIQFGARTAKMETGKSKGTTLLS